MALPKVMGIETEYGITVKKPEGLDEKTTAYIGKQYAKMFGEGFLQDVHIWKNKSPIQNPLLCEEDGPVYQLRRWYEQFYVDVDDILPEMVERFEFEVDASKAVAAWQEQLVALKQAGKPLPDLAPAPAV